jgi:flagellar basal body-associated protein FliL
MFNTNFLLSLPGGAEWIMIIIILLVLIACPVLAIVFYLQASRLRKENKELLAKLLERNK